VAQSADERVRSFLAETLELWQVQGSVHAAEPPGVAVIRTADGNAVVRIERAAREMPFRWVVRSLQSDVPAVESAGRPCASLVGLLNAVQRALGVERGSPIRIAPGGS